jgi:hypothetical protein
VTPTDRSSEAQVDHLLAELQGVTQTLSAHLESSFGVGAQAANSQGGAGSPGAEACWTKLLARRNALLLELAGVEWSFDRLALRRIEERLEAAATASKILTREAERQREELLDELSRDQQLRTALSHYGHES